MLEILAAFPSADGGLGDSLGGDTLDFTTSCQTVENSLGNDGFGGLTGLLGSFSRCGWRVW